MYTRTKYDIAGTVTERTEHLETALGPIGLIEYPDVQAQLAAEEWDLRDSTDA